MAAKRTTLRIRAGEVGKERTCGVPSEMAWRFAAVRSETPRESATVRGEIAGLSQRAESFERRWGTASSGARRWERNRVHKLRTVVPADTFPASPDVGPFFPIRDAPQIPYEQALTQGWPF